MRKFLILFAAIGLMAGFTGKVMAQASTTATDNVTLTCPVIQDIAISNTDGTNDLAFVAPIVPGNPVAAVSISNSWLNYTSIPLASTTAMITASITTGSVPTGTTLKVVAAVPTSSDGSAVTSAKEKGIPASAITLSGTAQPVIGTIKSCWTGSGVGIGSNLTYTWSMDGGTTGGTYSANSNTKSAGTLVITYTIGVTAI